METPFTFLATAAKMSDVLPHLGGMLVVFAALTVLWGLCAFTAKIVGLISPPAAAVAPAPKKAAAPAPTTGISAEVVAVISAAVATCAQGKKVVSIRPSNTSWEKAGRQSVFSSHKIR